MYPEKTTCFGPDNPAENIEVLLEHLLAEQTEYHYFRGQTNFFEMAAPSALRHFAKAYSEDKLWIELSSDVGATRPSRERAKTSFKQFLLLAFGRGVGNMLCQQYGVSSDAYDITGEPAIAAFFATCAYPTYKPFIPKKQVDQLGIIYRFTIKSRLPPPLSVMERTLCSLYLFDEDSGRKIWFDDVRSIRARVIKGQFSLPGEVQAYLDRQFPNGYTADSFFKAAAYVPYRFIEAAFLERAAQLDLVGVEKIIRSSRTYSQRGGLYFPPTEHRGFVSQHVSAIPLDGRDYIAEPGIVETLGAQRVFNLNANPYVELFFFRHDPTKAIVVERLDVIWPSEEEDFLLAHLMKMCIDKCGKYFDDFHTTPLDFDLGLLDPGYRNEV